VTILFSTAQLARCGARINAEVDDSVQPSDIAGRRAISGRPAPTAELDLPTH
jgi:hypothetical protein